MISVIGLPEEKFIDPIFLYLLQNHSEILKKFSLKNNDIILKEVLPNIGFGSLEKKIQKALNQRMKVIAAEATLEEKYALFLLTYEELNLGYNEKGEPKTPRNLSGVLPDLVLKGIRMVYNTSDVREEKEGIYVFYGLPMRLAPYFEMWIDKAIKGELLRFREVGVSQNIKGIRQSFGDFEEEIVVLINGGVIHSLDCELGKGGFLLDIDKKTMDEIIAGKYMLPSGVYIGPNIQNPYIYNPSEIKPEICRKCGNSYLRKFGYEII